MITEAFAKEFAAEWIAAWNSHDLDRILSHYTEDFTIETPMAQKLVPESGGLLRGKPAIRAYWTIGLEKIPNLEFQLLDLLIGINSVALYYINTATGRKSAEVMFLDKEEKVHQVVVHYS